MNELGMIEHDIRLKALADVRCVSALENKLHFFADASLDGFWQHRMDTKLKSHCLLLGISAYVCKNTFPQSLCHSCASFLSTIP